MRVALSIAAAVLAAGAVSGQSVSSHTASVSKPAQATATDPVAPYEHWITGEILNGDGIMLFRADRPVKGNPRGNVVILGLSSDTAKVLGPMYVRAAERHSQVRLFGVLLPYSEKAKDPSKLLPNVEFMTWKMHLPSDPDVLAPGQRIDIDGGLTTVGNVPVQLVDPDGRPFGSGDKITVHPVSRTGSPAVKP